MSDKLIEAINKLTDTAAKLSASQSDDKAIETAIKQSQDRATPNMAPEDKAILDAELKAKIDKYMADREKAQAEKTIERKATMTLGDATKVMADAAECKAETKALYSKLGALKAQNHKGYASKFGDGSSGRHPLNVLIYGAFEPGEKRSFNGSTAWTVKRPMLVDDPAVRDVWDANDACYFWYLGQKAKTSMSPDWSSCPFIGWYREKMAVLGKALDTTDWANFVPTGFSAAVIEAYESERKLVNQLEHFLMPRNNFDLNASGARMSVYTVTENTADTDYAGTGAVTTSDPEDLKVTLALVDFAVRTEYSVNVDEDSIVPVLDRIRREIARAWGYWEESAILNANSAAYGSHHDTGAGIVAGDPRAATWDGLRQLALANAYTTNAAAVLAGDALVNCKKAMGEFGANPDEGFWTAGPASTIELLNLKDAASGNPIMIGAAFTGAMPGAQTLGTVPTVFGSPWVMAASFNEQLTTAGIYDGSTTTKKALLYVNRRGPIYAYTNQAPTFYTRTLEDTLQHRIVMHLRREFEDQLAIASNRWVNYLINVT